MILNNYKILDREKLETKIIHLAKKFILLYVFKEVIPRGSKLVCELGCVLKRNLFTDL